MKKILSIFLLIFIVINCFSFTAFASEEQPPNTPSEPEVPIVTHRVTINWLFDSTGEAPTMPPFTGTSIIGSTSFDAAAGNIIDMSNYLYNPAGASYWQEGFINYNGIPCYLEFTYAAGGKAINPVTGEAIDGYEFAFDPFGTLTMPDTDVDIYYLYAPYYTPPEIPESTLDKIVIYVNRPTGDINPVKQEYRAYEILHVGKTPDVQEDVTNDYTVGKDIMPDDIGFSYWISTQDPWFEVVAGMTDYFVLTETTTEGYYIVELNPLMPSNEDTAKAIAKYLEEHIPENTEPKIVTADTPSYDNDPGYYLIISDINSNLILGTTNIAITEKAEYPHIEKAVAETDVNAGIGEEVTFSVTTHFPEGSKAEAIFSDVMTNGLTYVEGSLTVNCDYEVDIGHAADGNEVNGFTITVSADTIKALAAESGGGDVTFTYRALVNNNAAIGPDAPNTNSVRLDYSHFAQSATVDVYVTSFTLLKYDAKDENKTPLADARFQLLDSNMNPIDLVIIDNHKEYRIATTEDDSSVVVNEFITADSEIIIKGLDADLTYYLREIAAPSGYNLMTEDKVVIPASDMSTHVEVPNNSGSLLPSTGGIGTTIFYVIGGIFAVVAGILLITKLRVSKED